MLILYFHKGHGSTLYRNVSFNKNLVWIQHVILNFDNLLQNLREKKKNHKDKISIFSLPCVERLSKFPKAFL